MFANDGTHAFDNTIDTGTGASSDVLLALTVASDHLPIVMDFAGVPEPSTIVLSGLGILALVGCSGRMRCNRRSVP